MTIQRLSLEERFRPSKAKRILCLDGGGVRGVMTLEVLAGIESLLRTRHDDEKLVLSDYFDLIAGTSTGAIIAAALAKGMPVSEIQELYRKLAKKIFKKTLFRQGLFRAKYDKQELTAILQGIFGADTLGSENLKTGLLVVMKRADTSSPWPVSNNPRGSYFAPKNPTTIPNRDYSLWSVVRASTAAPSFFDAEPIDIANGADGTPLTGTFVDGGVSTANNPSLLAFRFVTLEGYNVKWQTGEDQLLLVSVGTGTPNPSSVPSVIPGKAALEALLGLMSDCNAEIETMMQWLGRTDTGRTIDSEIGALEADHWSGKKFLTYQRYNVELSAGGVNGPLAVGLSDDELDAVQKMDAPKNVPILEKIGRKLSETVKPHHFPGTFDLTAPV
jgi:hypothetical protein